MKKIPITFLVIAAIITMAAYNPSALLTIQASATLDFPNTSTNFCQELGISVPGADVGDVAMVGFPNGVINIVSSVTAYVWATDQVTVRFCNHSTVIAHDPPSATFKVVVID
jgi:hypothetical protein